jgi:Iap family predicted aminopeptidase
MRRHLFSLAIAVLPALSQANPLSEATLSSIGLSADTIDRATLLRDEALEGSRAYEWVERLTTEVGPRLAGSEAEARARDWAVTTLEELGFDEVWVEPFEIDGWERGIEMAEVVAPFPQPLSITALGGSIATPAGGVQGELVAFSSLAELQAAEMDEVAGKIVYVGHSMQKTQDGSSYGHFGRLRRSGAVEAAKKGAIAIMIRSIGTDSHRMPHTGSMRYADGVERVPAAALSNPDADQLERMLKRDVTLTVRLEMTPRALGKVRSANVIADIKGSEHPEQIVVMGGHLDSWDLGTGAIDDGAGVAITMEAARMILDSGWRPKRTIRLILWGAEEVGLLGGFAYAEQHKDELRNHVAGTESDFGAGRIWQMTSDVSEAATPVIEAIGALVEPLGIAPGATDAPGGGPDLTPMVRQGFPSFRFVQNGMDYFDLHHTHDDTLDKINPHDLDQSVAAYVVFAMLAADSDISDWGWESP